MGLDITTKAVIERIVRGVHAAEEQSVKVGAEESTELSSLILDIKKRIGAFVRERNDMPGAFRDECPPLVCTFCGSRHLKFRRPLSPRSFSVQDASGRHHDRDEHGDSRMSGYWFCLSCGQIQMRRQDVFEESLPAMQGAAG